MMPRSCASVSAAQPWTNMLGGAREGQRALALSRAARSSALDVLHDEVERARRSARSRTSARCSEWLSWLTERASSRNRCTTSCSWRGLGGSTFTAAVLPRLQVLDPVHDAHAARAEPLQHPVAAVDDPARSRRPVVRGRREGRPAAAAKLAAFRGESVAHPTGQPARSTTDGTTTADRRTNLVARYAAAAAARRRARYKDTTFLLHPRRVLAYSALLGGFSHPGPREAGS